jgi:CIC family chloride channel protein
MVAVSLSTALASRLVERSFFLTQLERRGVRLAAGPQVYLAATIPVARVLRPRDARRAAPEDACRDLMAQGVLLTDAQTLDAALRLFETSGADFLPVVRASALEGPPELLGAVFEADALRAYTRALADTAAEEHS